MAATGPPSSQITPPEPSPTLPTGTAGQSTGPRGPSPTLPPGPSGPSLGEKRPRDPSPPPIGGALSTGVGASSSTLPPPQKRTRPGAMTKGKAPANPRSWSMPSGEVPTEAITTKATVELHARILWLLPNQTSLPPPVVQDLVDAFDKRYTSEEEIKTTVRSAFSKYGNYINDARKRVAELRKLLLPLHSTISDNIGRVGEAFLILMFQGVASNGLTRWAPDILGDAESMYNLVHEHVCLFTLTQVASIFGYNFMSVNLDVVRNKSTLMSFFYRSFVFGRMKALVRMEARCKGRVKEVSMLKGSYERRAKLAHERTEYLKSNGFPVHTAYIFKPPAANSDDECETVPYALGMGPSEAMQLASAAVYGKSGASGSSYNVLKKVGRAEKVTTFAIALDEYRVLAKKFKVKNATYKEERTRNHLPAESALRKDSKLTAFPKAKDEKDPPFPIDWYAPDYFNNHMTLYERHQVVKDGIVIALPPIEHCTADKWKNWKNLSRKDFMKKYGKKELKKYIIPTADEVALLEAYAKGDATLSEYTDSSDEEDEVDDSMGDVPVVGNAGATAGVDAGGDGVAGPSGGAGGGGGGDEMDTEL
ncbi:hypothetical protein SCHPADRAFT_944110 [Schizopora paradoxa]|uniref:Uncharacterized protein n=1 Tax=Schizopora paradoxa TaxID=27342 RepID=A0A0H2RH94_9AGAM|nr:hypothetical protein SCHPADRAFT_944110 [Schizopora paradoxa]